MDIVFIPRWRVFRKPIRFFKIDKVSNETFRTKFFVSGFTRSASVSAAARRGASLYLNIIYWGLEKFRIFLKVFS